jgi:hypothetical protein
MNSTLPCDCATGLFARPSAAIIEVGIVETYEEAWLHHLPTHPEDHYANVKIFNPQKPGPNQRDLDTKAPERRYQSY